LGKCNKKNEKNYKEENKDFEVNKANFNCSCNSICKRRGNCCEDFEHFCEDGINKYNKGN
jgi:hypothetical protein